MSNVPLPFQPLVKYADFQGRARRSEFWLFWLVQTIFLMILSGISMSFLMQGMFNAGNDPQAAISAATNPVFVIVSQLSNIASLALFIPNLAVGVRRMHDINRTGWWIVLPFGVLLAGILVFLVLNAGSLMALISSASNGETPDKAIFSVLGQSILLIWLPSFIAGVVVFVFHVLDGTPNMNRFGPDPKGRGVQENIDTTFS